MDPHLQKYDDTVVPHLRRIRHCAKMVKYHADGIVTAAEQMAFLPDWLTRAEADIESAMLALHKARDVLEEKTREKV